MGDEKESKKKMGVEVSPGAVIEETGSSRENKTGSWRISRPVVNDKCSGCRICVWFCPENSIRIVGNRAVIDYDYCKGCMICVNECPVKAIEKKE